LISSSFTALYGKRRDERKRNYAITKNEKEEEEVSDENIFPFSAFNIYIGKSFDDFAI
jgi:hypothetical protein